MELDNLDILKNIKRIEVPDALYHTIECRFEKNRENNIPILKVGLAASFVIGLMLAQFYFLGFSSEINQSNNEIELVEVNNNSLYYE